MPPLLDALLFRKVEASPAPLHLRAMIGTDLTRAAEELRKGNIVGIPTETVYGLAANAYDEEAVLKIFQAKNRPSFDPLIVHVHDRTQVDEIVAHIPPEAEALMKAFWPGPLTLVLPKTPRVPDIVTSGLDTVGVRMPAHPLTLQLLRSLDFPLAAPSANPFGYISPTTAQHVADQLGEVVPYILDGGPSTVGVESTILGWESSASLGLSSRCVLYRAGGIAVEAIEEVIGPLSQAPVKVMPVAPGMIESHYAPRKPLIVGDVDMLLAMNAGMRAAVITFTRPVKAWYCEILSYNGDLNEAARHLFSSLRALDQSDAELIIAEIFPNEGLGRAINDRLRRAAARRP
jgi:L-threonylcarbamoyladenylate synthase